MKVLIAMDSFKGNLTSLEVAGIVEEGILSVIPSADIVKMAVADGGEGSVDAIVSNIGGSIIKHRVSGPMGSSVFAKYVIINNDTAFIEMAEASGITLVNKAERNPLKASSTGTGLLIRDAVDRGCKKIILAIGGTCTNDGGMGIAHALGVRFYNANNEELSPCGDSLRLINHIDYDKKIDVDLLLLTDVTNTLLGSQGATMIYGPQKGADSRMLESLETGMQNYASLIQRYTGRDISLIPGTGAAGGTPASLIAFWNAEIKSGIDYILSTIYIEEKIIKADIVITGEGRIDHQTSFGKLPVGIAKIAKKHCKPVFAIAGFLGDNYESIFDHGIDAAVSSMVSPLSLEEAISHSKALIGKAAANLFRIILVSSKLDNIV